MLSRRGVVNVGYEESHLCTERGLGGGYIHIVLYVDNATNQCVYNRHENNVALMSGQRRRRWPDITAALGRCVGYVCIKNHSTPISSSKSEIIQRYS